MSVTFHAVGGPTHLVACWMCEDHRRWEDDPTTTCCASCDGMREEPVITEANFSNHNARNILHLLGLDSSDLWGEIACDDIPTVLQRMIPLINVKAQREHLNTPTVVDTELGRCTVIWGGNEDDQTLRRLHTIQKLLVEAHQGGFGISWG